MMSKTLICAVLFLSTVSFVGAERTVPFSGEKINDEFCGISAGDEQCFSYLKYVGLTRTLPGAAMAGLSIVAFFFYFCFHCVACCCCGLGQKKIPSKTFVGVTRGLIIVSTIGVAVAFAVMIVGNINTTKSVNHVEDSVLNMERHLSASVTNVTMILTTIKQNNTDIYRQINETKNYIDNTIRPSTKNVNDKVNYGDMIRFWTVNAIFIAPMLLGVMSFIGATFKIRGMTTCAGFLLFFISTLLWVSFSVHFTVDTVATDLCEHPLTLLENISSNNTGVTLVTDCLRGQNTFHDLSLQLKDSVYTAACAGMKSLCENQRVQTTCPASNTCFEDTIGMWYNSTVKDLTGDIPIRECADKCVDGNAQKKAEGMVNILDTAITAGTVIVNYVAPLIDCTSYQHTFDQISTYICKDLKVQTRQISYSSLAAGILLIFLTIASLMGWLAFKVVRDDDTVPLLENSSRYNKGYNPYV